jgi:pimeloyl-ACP methyl ester carboxylesterase
MGGKVAMTLALQHPERVLALIAADIAPVSYKHDHEDIIGALRAVDLAGLESRAAANESLATRIPDPMVRQFLLTNLQRSGERFQWRIPLDILADQLPLIEGFPELAGRYEGPALFIHGALSDYVTPEMETAVRRLFPNAKIAAVEGAGHWLHVEQPAAFAEQLKTYLAKLD